MIDRPEAVGRCTDRLRLHRQSRGVTIEFQADPVAFKPTGHLPAEVKTGVFQVGPVGLEASADLAVTNATNHLSVVDAAGRTVGLLPAKPSNQGSAKVAGGRQHHRPFLFIDKQVTGRFRRNRKPPRFDIHLRIEIHRLIEHRIGDRDLRAGI